MQQYNTIKVKHPDALLLFRVGDFYETFGEEALKAAKILDIILTHRNNGGDRTELAGFPHHSLNTYLPKLVKAGQRVAICDQLEDPKLTKTIVKRGVTELVTPGVSLNDDILSAKSNNFLCAVHFGRKKLGVSFVDISTGEFLTAEGNEEQIDKLLQNFAPNEVLISKAHKKEFNEIFGVQFHTFYLEDWIFQEDYALENLTNHFRTKTLKGFGVDHLAYGIIAAGVLLHYLSETQHRQLKHINTLQRITEDEYIWMDRFTIRNLELYQSTNVNAVTLIDVIDKTISPMGGRMIKRWLALPLKDIQKIKDRHQVVSHLMDKEVLLEKFQSNISQMGDLERLISKISTGKVNPKEVVQLKNSMEAIVPIKQLAATSDNDALALIGDQLQTCDLLRGKIKEMLNEEAPVNVLKGNVIASGYSEELDELRGLAPQGKSYLDNMLRRETEATGITSLKIASNNVFGYYIEVRNTHRDKVPEEWIRKQTLVNAERYITEDLKEYEAKILGAEERILHLEQQLFGKLVIWMNDYIQPVQQNAQLIAQLDCLCSFAEQAKAENYCKPEIEEHHDLNIEEGRHPVIEKQLPIGESYVTNNVTLDRENQQVIMITGPNMSGKSAILRQTALIVLMAQMGCFVPASSARIGRIDKVFSRVGASDNISSGESTFMVEMNETSSILNNVSPRSLILLDEIGRGTSTYDGISIAWAIAEFLHESTGGAPKTLFATHYHELNQLADKYERVKNYNVATKESRNQIVFLRKLQAGGSHHSFGIQVARMAGMPDLVIDRARQILSRLESKNIQQKEETQQKLAQMEPSTGVQLSMFGGVDPQWEAFRDELKNLDLSTMTPIECMMKLKSIQENLDENNKAPSKNR